MFTGLVQDIGTILSVELLNHGVRANIQTEQLDLSKEKIGASISCSGCCLTVTNKDADNFSVEISKETLSKTNIADWKVGTRINLEPSLRMGDELGGHLVSGHIDGLALIENIEAIGDCYKITLNSPDNLLKYIAIKGSITLEGVSLTVNEVDERIFSVNIIPHTWNNTNLQFKNIGQTLNLEIDMLARYIERLLGDKK